MDLREGNMMSTSPLSHDVPAAHGPHGTLPLVQPALTGMAAVSAGLLLASVVKMTTVLPRHWRPWLFVGLAFIGVGVVRRPLLVVLGVLAPWAIIMAWKGKD